MTRTSYQLMKNDEPIAIGSMIHCLDVFYWEIYHSYNHLAYNIVPFRQDEEVYCKAKVWEQFKNDYHTEITQAIDNLFKLNNMDIAGETIFLLEKILNDMTEDKQND